MGKRAPCAQPGHLRSRVLLGAQNPEGARGSLGCQCGWCCGNRSGPPRNVAAPLPQPLVPKWPDPLAIPVNSTQNSLDAGRAPMHSKTVQHDHMAEEEPRASRYVTGQRPPSTGPPTTRTFWKARYFGDQGSSTGLLSTASRGSPASLQVPDIMVAPGCPPMLCIQYPPK